LGVKLGDLVDDRFRVLRLLGSGGSARVFAVEDLRLARVVALKVSRAPDSARRAARREFSQLARLGHPHLVQVHHFGRLKDGRLYLTSELVDGDDLRSWATGRSVDEIAPVLVQICRALHYLHGRGVLHGDLKPENVLVEQGPSARLVDFGLSTALHQGGVQGSGTPRYVAPEILEGAEPTALSDLFSLGVLMGELLPPGVLGELQRWLTAETPARRPPSAAAVIAAMGQQLRRDFALKKEEMLGRYFPSVPFVGRELELDRLLAMESGVVLIRGAAGVGKTCLLEELRVRLLLEQPRLVRVETSLDENLPLVSGQLEPRADDAVVLDRLVDGLVHHLAGAEGPTALLLDGLRQDDQLGLRTLRRLCRAGQVRCYVTVGSDEWSGEHDDLLLAGAELLELGGLSPEELERFLRGMLPEHDHTGGAPQIHSATEGNPRLVEEIVRLAIESGAISAEQPRYSLEPAAHVDLRRLARQRVELLDPPTRERLTRLALYRHGAPSDGGQAQEFRSSRPLGALRDKAAELLERRGLVRRDQEGRLHLANSWLRAALLEGLSAAEREQAHLALAASLERLARRSVSAELELAEQLCMANRPEQAAPHLLSVGVHHAARFDLAQAVDLCRRCVDLAQQTEVRAEALGHLARLHRMRGELEQAVVVHRALMTIAEQPSSALHSELELVETLVTMGCHGEAVERLERICAHGGPARAHLLWARALLQQGDHRAAERQGRRGLDAEELAPGVEADLQHLVGLARLLQGADGALDWLQRAFETYRKKGLVHGEARAMNSLGLARQRQADLAGAAEAYHRSHELFRRVGDVRAQTLAMINLGTVAQQRWQLAEALDHYRQGLVLARGLCSELEVARVSLNLGNLLVTLGELEEGARLLEQAADVAQRLGLEEIRAHASLFTAELWLARRSWQQARQQAQQAAARFAALGLSGAEAEAHLVQAEACLGERAWDEARDLLGRLEGSEVGDELQGRQRLLAAVLELDGGGDTARGRDLLEHAVLLARRGGAPDLVRRCHLEAARAAIDATEADYHRRKASQARQQLLDRVPGPYREAVERVHLQPDEAMPAGLDPWAATLSDLLRINRELTHEHQPERVLELIVDRAVELTGAERGFVILAEKGGMRVAVARNIDQETLRRKSFKFSRSVAESVMASGESLVAADALQDERFSGNLSVHEMSLRSVICVPLRMQERSLGALYLDNRFRRGAFAERHLELLLPFADQAAIALHNARLLREAEQRAAELALAKAEVESLNARLQATVQAQAERLDEITARLGSEPEELVRRYRSTNVVGRGKAMCEIYRLIDRVAQTDVPVLVQGETGTGKEVVAKAIHHNSDRRKGPFVSINCAAIPAPLLESELFGHVRGSFTGAVRDKRGLFEVARGGTLLLDEVGDMPHEMQAKLLRVLQEGAFRRVGDQEERTTDARIVSASLHDLTALVGAGRFREDLYYRLNVVRIDIPPLRERPEDIPELVLHFLGQLDRAVHIAPQAMELLMRRAWPGNIRELHNELLRAAALSDEGVITPDLVTRPVTPESDAAVGQTLAASVAHAERGAILRALRRCDGSVTRAAELLGISRVVLHRKLRKHNLRRGRGAGASAGAAG